MLRREFLSLAAFTAMTGIDLESKPEAKQVAEPAEKQNDDARILRIESEIHDCVEVTPIDWFEMKPGDQVICYWPSRPYCEERWWISGKPYWDRTVAGGPVKAVAVSRSEIRATMLHGFPDLKSIPKPMPSK